MNFLNPTRYFNLYAANYCVQVIIPGGHGTGVVVAQKGKTSFILTCAHVLGTNRMPVVVMYEKSEGELRSADAKLVVMSPKKDLALLKCKNLPVSPIELGDREPPRGATLTIASCPDGFFGLTSQGTLCDRRSADGYLVSGGVTLPGCSGSPAILYGKLVGLVNSMGKSGLLPVWGIANVIPLQTIKTFLDEELC